MGLTRARVTLLLAGAAAVAAVALAAWRAGWMRVGPAPESAAGVYAREAHSAGVRAFEAVKMERLEPGMPVERVRAAIAAAELQGEVPADREVVQDLLHLVADLIYYRFCQPSPAAYREWRASRGDRPRELSEMVSATPLARNYESFLGRPLPAPDATTAERVFDELWLPSIEYGNGYNRAVGLAADDAGVLVRFGTWRSPEWDREAIAGKISADAWRGAIAANMRSWWSPPATPEEIIRKHGSATYAEVGVVMAYASGHRRPLQFCCVLDPDDGRWHVLFVTAQNIERRVPLSPMEF